MDPPIAQSKDSMEPQKQELNGSSNAGQSKEIISDDTNNDEQETQVKASSNSPSIEQEPLPVPLTQNIESTIVDAVIPAANNSDPSKRDATQQQDELPAEQEIPAQRPPPPPPPAAAVGTTAAVVGTTVVAAAATTTTATPPPQIPPAGIEEKERASLSVAEEPAEEQTIADPKVAVPPASVHHIMKNDNLLPPPTKKRKKRTIKPKPPAEDRTKPFVPFRDYYHSNSFIKFKDSEWERDVDSDDEVDHSWRRRLEKSQLNDFTDIPKEDKDLMHLWNSFIRSDTIIRAKSIPQRCLNFIEAHATQIRDAGIGEQLTWHLVNLWDEGLISSDHMSVCLDHYNKIANGAVVVVQVADEKISAGIVADGSIDGTVRESS